MAKRKAKQGARSARRTRKASSAARSAKRPTVRKSSANKAAPARRAKAKSGAHRKPAKARPSTGAGPVAKKAKLDRARRTLDEPVQGPPSSLDMDQHGSAARTGRAEIAENLANHRGMAGVTGGDPDVDIEDAYFAGEEAPGGDNPTPDQDIVDDIGRALGVEYEDNEELKASDKVVERDRHRWELDPASSEDYKDRK
jgi:Family of unknown function (DUF6335)